MIENPHPSDKNPSDQGEFQDNKNATAEMFFHSTPEGDKKAESKQNNMKCLRQGLTSICFQIFITILAIFSLFSDDVRTAAFDARADLTFDIIHIVLIVIFMVEIILSWIAFESYRFSFFFFLDVISTLSILLDISMITKLIYSNNDSSYSISQLATQSRASRVATRAVRIVKLIRIIRIVKLYKSAVKAAEIKEQLKKKRLDDNRKKQKDFFEKQKETQNHLQVKGTHRTTKQQKMQEMENQNVRSVEEKQEEKEEEVKENSLFDSELIEEMSQKESKISKVLSDLTIKKIIIVVLLIMFLVPLFDSDSYIGEAESWDFTVKNIHQLLKEDSTIPISSIKGLINDVIENHSQLQNFIVYFSTPFNELPTYEHESYKNLRFQEISSSIQTINIQQILKIRPDLSLRKSLNEQQDNQIYAVMNYQSYNQKQALFSMGKTLFVCIVLIGMLHFFTEDINELIVVPIENMMKQVMEMAKNPQSAATSLIDNTQYETAIVHNAIVKIGALLSLVFGSAGAQIIGSNIMKEGDMDALIDGKKKCAIFGFCDIRNFTQVTELLQEDIMLFVNKIGQLVHSSVYRYGGSANKNIGQAFLLVWPLPNDSYELNNKTNDIVWKKKSYVNVMSDFSVFSFVKMIVKVHKDPAILQYKNDPRLKKGLGDSYQVSMGFGLHIGWAIQGAIGSQYKIDASYLSPNVNMASRLEAATKQYDVDLLISEDLYDLLTPSLQLFCRNIDKVTVKGSAKPIRLYTIDMNIAQITPPKDKNQKQKSADEVIDVEYKRDINMQNLDDDKVNRYNAKDFVKNKKELRQVMFGAKTQDFKRRFEKGLQCYLVGSWGDAHLHLTEALKNGKNDGPTKNLLNYMKRFNYVAPESWKNYRSLTQK